MKPSKKKGKSRVTPDFLRPSASQYVHSPPPLFEDDMLHGRKRASVWGVIQATGFSLIPCGKRTMESETLKILDDAGSTDEWMHTYRVGQNPFYTSRLSTLSKLKRVLLTTPGNMICDFGDEFLWPWFTDDDNVNHRWNLSW